LGELWTRLLGRAARTEQQGQSGQDSRDRTARSGQPPQDSVDRTDGTVHLGQDLGDRTTLTGQRGQNVQEMKTFLRENVWKIYNFDNISNFAKFREIFAFQLNQKNYFRLNCNINQYVS
jgi:hypothetical protein